MTLEQFKCLARDNRCDSTMGLYAVAVFAGPWGTVSLEFNLDESGERLTAPDLEVVHALQAASRLTGKF